jgi:hypothetical protein
MYKDQWWARYKDAVLETNFDKLEERIDAAERAIAERLSLDGAVPADERLELQDARNALRTLKDEHRQLRDNSDRNQ